MIAKLARKASCRDMSISNMFRETGRRVAAHIAKSALVIENVHSHVVPQDSFRGIELVAMRALESLN